VCLCRRVHCPGQATLAVSVFGQGIRVGRSLERNAARERTEGGRRRYWPHLQALLRPVERSDLPVRAVPDGGRQDGRIPEQAWHQRAPRVGDEVTVFYEPARPEDAKVALGDTFKINGKLLLVVGAIFLTVGALMFLSVFALVVWVSLT
jgi:hypothetical protein